VLPSAAADERRSPDAPRPPYIRSVIDDELARSIAAAGAGGGVVVVAGQPEAGKSRTLFEALAASSVTRDRTLSALRPPDETAGAVTARPIDTLLDTPLDLDGPKPSELGFGSRSQRFSRLRASSARCVSAAVGHRMAVLSPRPSARAHGSSLRWRRRAR
jgi:hypothetical protein